MSGALVLALAIGSALVLAVALARLPVDRAPEEMVEWWPFVPAVERFSFVGDPMVWSVSTGSTQVRWLGGEDWEVWPPVSDWMLEELDFGRDAFQRWADDGGPA